MLFVIAAVVIGGACMLGMVWNEVGASQLKHIVMIMVLSTWNDT